MIQSIVYKPYQAYLRSTFFPLYLLLIEYMSGFHNDFSSLSCLQSLRFTQPKCSFHHFAHLTSIPLFLFLLISVDGRFTSNRYKLDIRLIHFPSKMVSSMISFPSFLFLLLLIPLSIIESTRGFHFIL